MLSHAAARGGMILFAHFFTQTAYFLTLLFNLRLINACHSGYR